MFRTPGRTEEAEKHVAIAESLGCGSFLVWNLVLFAGVHERLLRTSTLHVVDCIVLTSDESKLCHWADHFASVTQCSFQVHKVVLEVVPSIQAPSQHSSLVDDE